MMSARTTLYFEYFISSQKVEIAAIYKLQMKGPKIET